MSYIKTYYDEWSIKTTSSDRTTPTDWVWKTGTDVPKSSIKFHFTSIQASSLYAVDDIKTTLKDFPFGISEEMLYDILWRKGYTEYTIDGSLDYLAKIHYIVIANGIVCQHSHG